MPQSYIEYSSGLTATTFSVPFKYLNIDDVNAIGFNGVSWTPLTITTRSESANTITLSAAPSVYNKIRVYRQSTSNQLVDFQAGARLTESELDMAYNQGLFVAQEVSEDANTVQFSKLADAALLGSTSLAEFNSSSHTGDNSTVTFTLSFTPQTSIPQGFLVIVDGVLQSPVDAYTISIAPAQITFTSAPPTGASIVVTTAAAATGVAVNTAEVTATGSTTSRKLSDRFADTVNVKDFGAVGDGTTDDTSAIQAAIDHAGSLGGGQITIPVGTFRTNTLHLKTNVVLKGVSVDHTGRLGLPTPCSSLKLLDGADSTLLQIDKGVRACRIFDITLNGNRANNSGTSSVVTFEVVPSSEFSTYNQDSYVIFQRCTIWEGKGNGVLIGHTHRACKFLDSYIANNNESGIYIQAPDVTINSCLFGLNGDANIYLAGVEATHITNCDIFLSTYGIVVGQNTYFGSPLTSKGVMISNCGIDRAAENGLLVEDGCWGVLVSNSRFNGNSSGGAGQASHIINNSQRADALSVVNTAFDDRVNSGSPFPKYDIELTSNTSAIVAGNLHSGRYTLAVSNFPEQLRNGQGGGYITAEGKLEAVEATVLGTTKLGADAPAIKMKQLTGSTASATAGLTSLAHGVNTPNIISISVVVDDGGGTLIHPMYPQASKEFSYFVNGTNLVVVNGNNATDLLSKSFRALITYTA